MLPCQERCREHFDGLGQGLRPDHPRQGGRSSFGTGSKRQKRERERWDGMFAALLYRIWVYLCLLTFPTEARYISQPLLAFESWFSGTKPWLCVVPGFFCTQCVGRWYRYFWLINRAPVLVVWVCLGIYGIA